MTDAARRYGADTAAYLAYKHAVTSVGALPIPAAKFASPPDVMRHIVLVVDSAKAAHAALEEPRPSWWRWGRAFWRRH